jgi:hypothetical protein
MNCEMLFQNFSSKTNKKVQAKKMPIFMAIHIFITCLLTNTGIIFSKVFSKHKVQKKMHKHFCFQSVTNSEWDFHWFSLPFTCTIKMHTIVRGSLIPLFVPKFFCLYTLVLNHYGATFHSRTFTPNFFHFC